MLICSQTRGGRSAAAMAAPTTRAESTREFIMAARFASVYRQLTLCPARLITTSLPSISAAQSASTGPASTGPASPVALAGPRRSRRPSPRVDPSQ
ncbi:hypothetical protein GCM10009828_004310 [Actinoplanes couchii]|uniref:Uncharacterized protein n=1 Tax=Actinoplanes couchii TaxID=403638 RepID=A0ABQ3XI39_9ACTN|nr:hypothetical protein Aco03nite_065690 [Actinoplanes couchii]